MLTEVMAGEGSDLIFFIDDSMDIEKMARRGVFADLEPYFEADNFDWSGYNQTVMDAGVWDGHRLVILWNTKSPCCIPPQTAWRIPAFRWKTVIRSTAFWRKLKRCKTIPPKQEGLFRTIMAFKDFASMQAFPMWIIAHKRQIFLSQT